MKVVLFCGGMGMRLRDYSEEIPKPMVPIGPSPIIWNLMKYYASFGHKEFILCLGGHGNIIKDYFLHYNECVSNDFTLAGGKLELRHQDIGDWKITFVDTGQTANVGERLKHVEPLVRDEEAFLANDTDGLTDLHLPDLIAEFQKKQAICTSLCVKPRQSYHLIDFDEHSVAQRITPVMQAEQWMNGGFFAITPRIFDYMQPGEDLGWEPCQRLITKQRLTVFPYEGFWGCMDTHKGLRMLEELYASGNPPWEVWRKRSELDSGIDAAMVLDREIGVH